MSDVHIVTGSTPDDELIDRILWLLGVDPVDWANSLSGIYAAIRSNQQIGEPNMSKIEDWTDGNVNQDSLTESIFRLLERAQQAEAKIVKLTGFVERFAAKSPSEKMPWFDALDYEMYDLGIEAGELLAELKK